MPRSGEGERYVLLMVIPPAGGTGLSGVSVQWEDAEAETWPRNLPDLQPGKALVVAAKVSKEASLAVISGRSGRLGKTPWQVVLPLGSAAPGQAIDKLWARLQVEALSSGPRDERAVEATRPAITDLALRYGLVTEYTSLVAEDTVESAVDVANALPLRAWVPSPNRPRSRLPLRLPYSGSGEEPRSRFSDTDRRRQASRGKDAGSRPVDRLAHPGPTSPATPAPALPPAPASPASPRAGTGRGAPRPSRHPAVEAARSP